MKYSGMLGKQKNSKTKNRKVFYCWVDVDYIYVNEVAYLRSLMENIWSPIFASFSQILEGD